MAAIHPDILSQTPLFQSLTETHKKQLADICIPKPLKKKEMLFNEGDKGSALYLCLKGSIQLFKTSEDGQDVVIRVISPGELFGEVILFEKDRYPVTAVALEDCLVAMISKIQFDCLLEDAPFRKDFIASLMGKLRFLTQQIQLLTSQDVETRLFSFLKAHYGSSGTIHTALSKKDIAAAIGTTPETLSRLIKKLEKEGRLSWDGKTIRLK